MRHWPFHLLVLGLIPHPAVAQSVDFERDVRPIFVQRCQECHGAEKSRGDLRFTSRAEALAPAASGEPVIVPGQADHSPLLQRITARDQTRMPPRGQPLTPAQIDLLRRWINQGATWK